MLKTPEQCPPSPGSFWDGDEQKLDNSFSSSYPWLTHPSLATSITHIPHPPPPRSQQCPFAAPVQTPTRTRRPCRSRQPSSLPTPPRFQSSPRRHRSCVPKTPPRRRSPSPTPFRSASAQTACRAKCCPSSLSATRRLRAVGRRGGRGRFAGVTGRLSERGRGTREEGARRAGRRIADPIRRRGPIASRDCQQNDTFGFWKGRNTPSCTSRKRRPWPSPDAPGTAPCQTP